MTHQIIGKQRKQGSYEGNDYDNTYLHCISNEFLSDEFEGYQCSVIKVKTSQIPAGAKVGSVIDVQYNAFGKVLGIVVKDEKGDRV